VVEARQSVFKVIEGVFSDICGKRTVIEKEEVEVKHDSTNNVTNNEKV
ncbi:3845_t:CDS:1, partial [Gigaspora rosea]